jgi:hypothetical protein
MQAGPQRSRNHFFVTWSIGSSFGFVIYSVWSFLTPCMGPILSQRTGAAFPTWN